MKHSFFLALLGVLLVASCAFLKSIGRTAAVAGGGAGGALVGSAAGPVGTLAGAGVGAGAVYAVQENSELRGGSLQGEGARDNETDRLKSLLLLAQGDIQIEKRARYEAERAASWFRTWGVRLLLLGLVTRNAFNFPHFIRALLARRWLLALKWLAHIIIWPWRPKEQA